MKGNRALGRTPSFGRRVWSPALRRKGADVIALGDPQPAKAGTTNETFLTFRTGTIMTLSQTHPQRSLRRTAARRLRRAVTIMEVMFAIGVVMIGLLGLASLIPLAGRFAVDTLSTDRAAAMASAYDQVARVSGAANLRRLVLINHGDMGGIGTDSNNNGVDDYGSQTVIPGWYPLGLYPDPRGDTFEETVYALGQLSSPGPVRAGDVGNTYVPPGRYGAICIDSRGLPWGPAPMLPNNANYFRPGNFPYYADRVNPFEAPNARPSNPWFTTPRMWRATIMRSELGDLENFFFPTNNPRNLVADVSNIAPPKVADMIFRSADEVAIEAPEDRSAVATQQFFRSGRDASGQVVTTGGVPLQRASSPEYSWLATLVPQSSTGVEYELSVVIVEQRSQAVPSMVPFPVNEPADNMNAERIAWVGQAIGLTGGAGGDILIYGSPAVSPEVESGSWIMLSRQPWDDGTTDDRTSTNPNSAGAYDAPDGDIDANDPNVPYGPASHRWYRVVRAGDVEYAANGFAELNYPGQTTPPAWRRWLRVEGPDWNFFGAPNTNIRHLADDTFCTIVSGSVAVRTSTIVLE